MIINVWSTPRTGSVWFSFDQQARNPGSVYVPEMFNRYHMNLYREVSDGVVKNFHEYAENRFYTEYYLDDNQRLAQRRIYARRTRDIYAEENYCYDLIRRVNPEQILIMHNHVEPLNHEIRDYLIKAASENHWLFRRDLVQQLASYAVAFTTKRFVEFQEVPENSEVIDTVNSQVLQNLLQRIKKFHELLEINKHRPKTCIHAFEDLEFYDQEGFPRDQNTDPLKRLTPSAQSRIQEIIREYYDNSRDKQS